MIDLKAFSDDDKTKKLSSTTNYEDNKHSNQLDYTAERFKKVDDQEGDDRKVSILFGCTPIKNKKTDDSPSSFCNYLNKPITVESYSQEFYPEVNLNDLVIGIDSDRKEDQDVETNIFKQKTKRNRSSSLSEEKMKPNGQLKPNYRKRSITSEKSVITKRGIQNEVNELKNANSDEKCGSLKTKHKSSHISNSNSSNPNKNNNHKQSDQLSYYYANSFYSQINKYRFQLKVEANFDELFRIESPISYKEGRSYNNYHMILRSNIFILTQSRENSKLFNHSYYERAPKLVLDFDLVSVTCVVNPSKNQFTIVMPNGNEFHFQVPVKDSSLFNKVVIYLNYIIQSSKGNKEMKSDLCSYLDFHKSYRISEHDFFLNSKTGDILLFRGFEFPSKCQRFLTSEEYGKLTI